MSVTGDVCTRGGKRVSEKGEAFLEVTLMGRELHFPICCINNQRAGNTSEMINAGKRVQLTIEILAVIASQAQNNLTQFT